MPLEDNKGLAGSKSNIQYVSKNKTSMRDKINNVSDF